jgi:uncharacterized protein (DUF4415 family)
MSEENITRISLADALKTKSQTDWARLHREEALGIEPAADDGEDEFDWDNAVIVQRPGKQAMTIRLDDDVLAFFRATGKGYQTRINAVLRAYVTAKGKQT